MGRTIAKPTYRYDEQTTLKTLADQFLAANPGMGPIAAAAIKVRPETFDLWMSGTATDGLRTKCRDSFQETTGIDLDRLMVIESKRRVWKAHPGSRAFVTLEKFQTRRDVVDEIVRLKALPLYDGTKLIAWQLGTGLDDSLSRWSIGSNKPEGDGLDACVLGLSRGMIENGTRNDLAFRLCVRRVCGAEIEECLGVSTFEQLVNAVFTRDLRARGATIAGQQTGINVATAADLLKWKPDHATTFPYGTILNLVRAHVRERWNDAAKARLERAAKEFLDKGNDYAVAHPAFDGNNPVSAAVRKDAPVSRVDPPAVAPARETPAARRSEDVAARNGVARLSAHLRTQQLQLAMDFPDIVRRLPMVPTIEIGETIANARWCLTGANIPDVGDWNPTDGELEAIAESFALQRRTLQIVLALPMATRRRVVTRLAPELDELFLAFDASGVEDLVGFAEQINLQRQQAGFVRKGS